MRYNILKLDGKEILESYVYQQGVSAENPIVILVDEDTIKSTDRYNSNALIFQICSLLRARGIDTSVADCLFDKFFFIDFSDAISKWTGEAFSEIIANGFNIKFADYYLDKNGVLKRGSKNAIKYVPFESSNSQAKESVISFIREDLFDEMREIVDLGFDLEPRDGSLNLTDLSKLYAYRGLYLTDATRVADSHDKGFEDFFNERNIVVIDDIEIAPSSDAEKVKVATAEQTDGYKMIPTIKEMLVKINCFDGEGIILPDTAKLINKIVKKDENESSFQVRMPFFKGMLHTVDFQGFLDEMGFGDVVEIKDVFKKTRNIREAKIIVTASMFKLCSLKFQRTFSNIPDADPMKEYFERMKKYNHGLYLAKTESNLHNNGFTGLSYQFLNTLDISSEEFDEMANEHIKRADAYTVSNILNPSEEYDLSSERDDNDLMKLLKRQPLFVYDNQIRSQLRDIKISKYKELALGRITVAGETRFLSGDLMYFLCRVAGSAYIKNKNISDNIDKVKKNCNKWSEVYIPGNSNYGKRVALLRSPHLSRNEDVSAVIFEENDYYNRYLGHLKGVIMIGYKSYMAHALGGADFDGDTIGIIYDERVVKGCLSGYVEGENTGVPFVNINPLKSCEKSTPKKVNYKYLHPDVVYNKFSSRVGFIANAALKIAAVEYHCGTKLNEEFSAALCTILTGNEIDATKKGIRPYIDDVTTFSGTGKEQERIVKEINNYIYANKVIDGFKTRAPKVEVKNDKIYLMDEEFTEKFQKGTDEESITGLEVSPNRELSITCQLLYRWASLFVDSNNDKDKINCRNTSKQLSQIWSNAKFECPPQVEGVLNEAKKVLTSYRQIRRMKATVENQEDIVKRIKEILKNQYDNIYSEIDENSINAKYLKFQYSLGMISAEDKDVWNKKLYELYDKWFSEKKEKFNCNTYWPFLSKAELGELDQKFNNKLPYTEMVKNFDAKGHRLLGYSLKLAKKQFSAAKKSGSVPNNEKESNALGFFEQFKEDCDKKNVVLSQFEKQLAEKVQEKITEFFPEGTNPHDIVIAVYRMVFSNADLRKVFWKIYSVPEVLAVLEGVNYA